ncbi:MAG TPA: response regulator [Pyrinomonadaceae bacterium]|nr:response regulator [Pyrinomonadaceae bacterium]
MKQPGPQYCVPANLEPGLKETGLNKLFNVSYTSNSGYLEPMPARILIADDYEDNRELLRLLLASAKYHVLEAANGRDCLRMAIDEQPDLILIDLSMPVLDGWSLFGKLRSDERTERIPCVAVTAHPESDRNKALERGFSAYLTKPFRTAELLETVKQLLEQYAPNSISEQKKTS